MLALVLTDDAGRLQILLSVEILPSVEPESWIRCNDIDCIESFNVENEEVLANIRTDYRLLWDEECEVTKACPISSKLNKVCDCEYDLIQRQIDKGLIEPIDCGCAT